jgi:hypothetical protein
VRFFLLLKGYVIAGDAPAGPRSIATPPTITQRIATAMRIAGSQFTAYSS